MNAVRLLLILAYFLCFGAYGAAALEITDRTYYSYQRYLEKVGHDRKGAFAVSADGSFSHFIYCEDSSCFPAKVEKDALAECMVKSMMSCSVMVSARAVKIPFTVIPVHPDASDEIRSSIVDAAKLKELVVGNSLQGEYLNALKWAEYFDPSGEIHGKDDFQGAYKARWRIVGRELCFEYPNSSNWCAELSLQGDSVIFLKNGQVQNTIRNVSVHAGNTTGL